MAEVSSKKLTGHMPFVRSMIGVGSANVPGGISPRRKPTALNLRRARTSSMFAREGTTDGLKSRLVDVFRFDNVAQKH
jgi:hypothetical protein